MRYKHYCTLRKYHAKPVDAPVYYALRDKVLDAGVIRKSYPGYDVIYAVFSKSGFTQWMLDVAKETQNLMLINEDQVMDI